VTFQNISIPLPGREPMVWTMFLGDEHPQDAAIKNCLAHGVLPEMELMHVLIRAIKPGDYVVDCGACTGFFTLAMAALGARVLAIEPGENNLPSLTRNILANPALDITLEPVALGAANDKREFLLIDDGGVNSFTQPTDRPAGRKVMVDVRLLPDLIDQNPKFIKMDIEGSEYDALASWFEGPWTCPFIVIELNLEALNRFGRFGLQITNLMRSHGYEMFILFSDGLMPMWLPPGVDMKCSRQNTNVLFCKPEDICQLWPELNV
jgi:FkbM family methyltransferase